ncbi:anaphase promoting complex subunit 4 [Mortierella alpina]|uniref:Anaphase-promoting complex subunit 4 n=1 Tax=Mortierella alpina TaxID=64518 RepID=A0A9P6LZF0_MORAP|nr:anaphase promoting complex subunit 4 [Mortierella alpina]
MRHMEPGPQDQQASQQNTPQQHFDPSFDLYSEKQFQTAHRFAAWSPTADLIAIVNHQNDLDLYRLSWQRHWSVPVTLQPQPGAGQAFKPGSGVTGHGFAGASGGQGGGLLRYHRSSATSSLAPKADVVSLAWRPDGKMIAVGLSGGTVNVYDYRDGSLAYVISPTEEDQLVSGTTPIKANARCLRWADIYLGQTPQTALFGAHQTPKTILEVLPLLSPIPQTSTQQQLLKARSMFKNNTLGLPGTSTIKSGELLAENILVTDEESSDIMNVLFVGNDQGQFTLRLYGGFETDSISLSKLLEAYGVRGYKVRMLGLKKRPVNYLLRYLREAFEVIHAEYNKISQLTENCVERVQQNLTDNGEMTTPTHEFVQMLMTGRPSSSLDQYLQHELSHHGLKRWEKSAKAAYANMQRVAFECIIPACERLLIHLSDVLGCSRWIERYGPLQLHERSVYNCIKLVGDFMGFIEQLLLALKVELKQFSEFENWMEQVIEMLQPTLKGADDQGDEGPKTFPPVDVLGVSEYLKSGLTSRILREYFIESEELSTPSSDLHNIESTGEQPRTSMDEKEHDPLSQRYQASPTYPIVYSFAKELDVISLKHQSSLDTRKAKQDQKPPQSNTNNPFAGPAIKAALAGRGFGLLPSKKSSASALFARSGSSSPRPLGGEQNGGSDTASQLDSEKKRQRPLTLKKLVELMNKHCQAIFKGPATAVAKGMRVVNTVDLLEFGGTMLERSQGENSAAKEAYRDDMTQYLRLATRYCYHTSKPWHYTAVYLAPELPRGQPSLWILRSRNRSAIPSAATVAQDTDESPSSSQESAVSSTTQESQFKTSPRGGGITGPRIKQGRKRTASDEAPPTLAPQFKTRTKSFLRSPSSAQSASTALGEIISKNTHLSSIDDRIEQDIEVAVFSLQEHGTAMSLHDEPHQEEEEEADALALARVAWSQQPSDLEQTPTFEIRDLIFLDDNNLGVLLNSTLSTPTDTAPGRTIGAGALAGETSTFVHDEQYLVSVPLLSSGRPYQRLQIPRQQHPGSPGSKRNPCLLDRLVEQWMTDPNTDPEHASTTTTRLPLALYTLPINRSRRVTQFGEHSAARAEMMSSSSASASGPSNPMPRSHQPSSSISKPAAAAAAAPTSASSSSRTVAPAVATIMRTRAREQDLIGPCRIASNEREKGRVVSVHGPSHEGASTLQGAGKITVFEL